MEIGNYSLLPIKAHSTAGMVCGELVRGYVMATLCTDISPILQPTRGRVSKQEMCMEVVLASSIWC
jgi:hypothetical protein